MPEPITIASAIGAIVVNGIKLCLGVYGTIDGMKQAPKHLKAVSSDLKDFYSILGTIQGYLDDKQLTQGLLHTQSCDNLQSVLANCVSVLREFDKIVGGYIKAGQESSVTRWQKISWTWKIADVDSLRKHLSDHKASLSVAIGMANLINNEASRHASASRTAAEIQELREASASQLADAKAQIVALVTKLSRLDETVHDSNVIMENQRATIRAFACDAESILTCSLVEPMQTPSLQVSTSIADSTRSASFVTAWTSAAQGVADSNNAVHPRQLMIHGIGREATVLQSSEFRYDHQLMVAAREIPLLISGLGHYTESAQTIRSMWDHPAEVIKIRDRLCFENIKFQITLKLILYGSVGDRTLQAVLAQPGSHAWRKLRVEQELRRVLQGSYTVFLQLVVDMHGSLVAFIRRLRLGPDGPLNNLKSFREACKRFEFAPRKSAYMNLVGVFTPRKYAYMNLMGEINKNNKALRLVVQQSLTPELRARKIKSEAT